MCSIIGLTNSPPPQIFGMDSADVLTLKYAYGMAAVSTGIHKVFLSSI